MLEIQRIRNNKEAIIAGLNKRNFDAQLILEEVLSVDEKWRLKKTNLESIIAEMNKISKEIGILFSQGKKEEGNKIKLQINALKTKESLLKNEVNELHNKLIKLMYQIPNVPNELVKKGNGELDNEKIEEIGKAPKFGFKPLSHWEISDKFSLIDFELGVKITGSGFPVYIGQGAKLQRALINFFLEEAEKNGYKEYIPPLLVNESSGYATGQLPDKEGQMYYLEKDDLYLIPTAEVPLTNIYRNVIIPNDDFSIKIMGFTPCFRREAGSYGKDVRGLNRLHQFDKVEIVRIEHPSNSDKALNEMMNHIKELLNKLGLQYRVLRLCGGDMGFTASITYDFEVYSVAQDKWLEVSSVSRFDTFQSTRLKLRFKNTYNKSEYCHTLNGSALALPRILAALLENNQTANSIKIPKVLHKFTGFSEIVL